MTSTQRERETEKIKVSGITENLLDITESLFLPDNSGSPSCRASQAQQAPNRKRNNSPTLLSMVPEQPFKRSVKTS